MTYTRKYFSISEIRADYDNGEYTYNYEKHFPTYSEGHIFDENLSVKRNREMVEEANKKAKESKRNFFKEQGKLNKKLLKDCVDVFVDVYPDIAREVFEKIVQEVYNAKHDCMRDFFYCVDETADWVVDLINIQKVNE